MLAQLKKSSTLFFFFTWRIVRLLVVMEISSLRLRDACMVAQCALVLKDCIMSSFSLCLLFFSFSH